VFDGCQALEAGYGLDGYTAATMALIAACESLGFDTATCTELSQVAIYAVESTTICYDPVTHGFTYASDESECAEGEIFTNSAWDCYGLYALTFQSEGLCSAAAGAWMDDCVLGDSAGRTFQVMAEDFAPWGGFLTWNSVAYSQCLGAGGGDACNAFLVPDSTSQFDPACLADGDTSDCAGRLIMNMDPLCVPNLQVREVHIDFDQIDDCAANGDVTLDGTVNILDVVNLVQAILGSSELDDNQTCNADINSDTVVNILDVVAIVQSILGGRTNDATSIEIFNNNNTVTTDADGYVGAIQMTLSHGNDFSMNITDNCLVSDYMNHGTYSILVIVEPTNNMLFTSNDRFEIAEIMVANSNNEVAVTMLNDFSLSSAYPNPFNPSTSFDVSIPNAGYLNIGVYNISGQLVDVIANGLYNENNYTFSWDASEMPSGMYVINANFNGVSTSHNISLIK
jgi:hypothetical protein